MDSTDQNSEQNQGTTPTGDKIRAEDIQYLCFEGGGGKGIIYLGAVKALEKKISGEVGKPLFDLNKPIAERQLKGISGASAGSITAFLLAMGLSSTEVEKIMNETQIMNLTSKIPGVPVKQSLKVSRFEQFFEPANPKLYRTVTEEGDSYTSGNGKINTRNFEYPNMMTNGVSALSILSNSLNSLRIVLKDIVFVKYRLSFVPVIIRRLLFDEYTSIPLPNSGYKIIDAVSKTVLGPVASKYFEGSEFIDYLHSIIFNRGILAGTEPLSLFSELLTKHLLSKADKDNNNNLLYSNHQNAADITFEDFFRLTGVDLVVTGTNVTWKEFRYFSLYHTPRFPVIYAIAISMNIPFAFRPVFVNYYVNKREGLSEKEQIALKARYTGLYVDGGMLNNYPIHAFDQKVSTEALKILYKNTIAKTKISAQHDRFVSHSFNENILGFRLADHVDLASEVDKIFQKSELDYAILLSYGGSLFAATRNSAGSGQITSTKLAARTIELESTGIDILDFATLELDKERGTTINSLPAAVLTKFNLPKNPTMEKYKQTLINFAEDVTLNYFK